MKFNLKTIIVWLFIILPFIYLAKIYPTLPDIIPIHFDANGDANGWGNKSMLWYMPGLLSIGIYFLLSVIPKIDSKKKLQNMGDKYKQLKYLMTIVFSILSIVIINSAQVGSIKSNNLIYLIIGLLFIVLGNYFQSIKPNYFIGIRTPWTLENTNVWNKTHQLGGKVFFIGGLIIVISSLIINKQVFSNYVFLSIVVIMSLIPVVYSYKIFREEKIKIG